MPRRLDSRLSIRVERELLERALEIAHEQDDTVSALVRRFLRGYVRRHERGEGDEMVLPLSRRGSIVRGARR